MHNKCLALDFLWKQFKGPYRICFEVSKFLFVQFFVFWLVLSFGYQPLFAKGARAVEIESSSFVILFVYLAVFVSLCFNRERSCLRF